MLFIASDHAGFELKAAMLKELKGKTETEDLGTDSLESCDYPLFAKKLADKVLANSGSLGLLMCGTGIGMSIAANKLKGIRAAAVSDNVSAQFAREHNNANVLCLGSRVLNVKQALECLNAFLNAKFDTTSPRHQRRIDEITSFEK
ncbi:MAG: rpiB [Bacteriovoracaceae bacterium]|nr:rpiB [Bacteriovoracaceae bacterium]